MRPNRLEKLVAIVTGGGQGIGRAITARFVEEGASVLIVDVDREAATDAADEYGDRVRVHVGSVADEREVARAVAAAVAWDGRLDIVVNNAALADPTNAPIEELELAAWQRVLDVNLTGPMLFAKHGAAHLRARRGTIINITSTRAYMSEPNTEAYTTAKAVFTGTPRAVARPPA